MRNRSPFLRGLGDERGQTLVLFIVSLVVVLGLLALVVDVGAWLGAQRNLQNMADAAALGSLEQGSLFDPSTITAGTTASISLNPTGSGGTTATASDAAPNVFGAAVGFLGFNESATATAQSLPVSAASNSDLLSVAKPSPPATQPPFVVPIVVNQCVFNQSCACIFTDDCANQNLLNCTDPSVGCDLTFDDQDRTESLFGIANITAAPINFQNWMQCQQNQSNNCGSTTQIAAISSAPPLTNNVSGGGPKDAMNKTIGNTLILPVFSDFANNNYDLVGFSAFVVTSPTFDDTPGTGNWQAENVMQCGQAHNTLCCGHAVDIPCKVIHGYFTQYNLPASSPTQGFKSVQFNSGIQDFGVRGVGLTN